MAKISLFGFKLGKDDPAQEVLPSFSPPVLDDGAVTITAAAHYGTSIDLESNYKNDVELITRYREMAMQPEIESAVDDIINEAIIQDEDEAVKIVTDNIKASPKVRTAIDEEFQNVLTLLNFKNLGQDIFRRYYVDGRLFYNIILDKENPQAGIQELRYTDPRKISKIRELKKVKDKTTGFDIIQGYAEYYIYSDSISTKSNLSNSGLKIAPDSIICVNSGLLDSKRSVVLSYLHKSIKPLNQLRMIEDATIIYKICLVGDTRIKTNTGWKYIKDISEDDIVYSFYGLAGLKETKVKKQWLTDTKQTYKVSSKYHNIIGTSNHPILVLDKTTNVVEYIEIENLIPKKHSFVYSKPEESVSLLVFPEVRDRAVKITNTNIWPDHDVQGKGQLIVDIAENLDIKISSVKNFLYGNQYLSKESAITILESLNLIDTVELSEKYEFINEDTTYNLPEYIDEEFARLFGFFLGDGVISKGGLTFAEGTDKTQNEFYADILTKYFGNCSRINSNRKYSNYTTNNTLAAELFKKLEFKNGAKIKRLPSWIYNCDNDIKRAMILGLADADGHTTYSELSDSWASTIELNNKQLIEDIKELWTSLGYCSSKIQHRIRPTSERVVGDEIYPRIMPETESWNVRITNKLLPKFDPILEIIEDEIADVYDVEVESEKHNFIANGIVVHNSRAPERRIFYIDVGNLPKMKAEQYLKDIMTKYKNKVVYDANTGAIRDDRRFLSMQEDFWLPRRNGQSTEITTLPSSAAFDDMSMVEYFEKKLYKSLNVPYSRLVESDSPFDSGNPDQISRDEIKFAKFINRLRLKFTDLFDQALRVQCYLKGICSQEEFDSYKQHIYYDFQLDNHYAELIDAQLLQNRMGVLDAVAPYVGKYYSQQWIQKNILQFSDEDIKQMIKEIQQEIQDGLYPDPRMAEMDPALGGMPIDASQDSTPSENDGTDDTAEQPQSKPAKKQKDSDQQTNNPYYTNG